MCLRVAPFHVIVTTGRLTQTWEHSSIADFYSFNVRHTKFDLYAVQSMHLLPQTNYSFKDDCRGEL